MKVNLPGTGTKSPAAGEVLTTTGGRLPVVRVIWIGADTPLAPRLSVTVARIS